MFLVGFNSYAETWKPDEMNLPKNIHKKSPKQIQQIFDDLESQHNNKPANLWFLKYKKALLLQKKDLNSFCNILTELSTTVDFPLKTLAKIKSYPQCPFKTEPLFDPNLVPKWLELELAKAFYQRRNHFDHFENTLNATVYLAQNSDYKELRLSYLKHAISLVKQAKKPNTKHNLLGLQQRLYKESPSLNPVIKPKDFFLVAQDFKSKRQFKKAKSYYIKVLNSPDFGFKEKNSSFKALGHIYKIQKDKKRLLRNTKQRSKWLLSYATKDSLTAYAESQLELARKQWNANKNLLAIQSLSQLLKTQHAEFIKEKALFLRGSIYLQENQIDLSLKDWETAIQLLQKQKHQKNLLAKLLWKKALLFRKQKKYKDSYKSLVLLKKLSANNHNHNKALFWMAKTMEDLGRNFLAKRHYKELIEKDHFGYYGLLARKNLNKKWEIKKVSIDSLKIFEDDKQKALIYWLNLIEEPQMLSLFLKELVPIFLRSSQTSQKDWLKMIWFWTKSGHYLDVFKALSNMDDKTQKEFATKYLALFFPLDFYSEVEKTSQKLQIPKALIFAVIRQESAFNTRARSPADAFGLMQLIPRTARHIAREQKTPFKNFRELYQSSKNILLGTAYLKKLLKQTDQLYLSIATYNAGPTAVKKWQKEFPDLTPLEFVENISYEETRNYIRLVIRNYIIYHNLLSESENWFPEILTKEQFF